MAAAYQLSLWRRLLNALVRALLSVGLGPANTYLLTVQGRRTGRPYSTPVTLVEESGERWIVAPYGEVNWVRNARSAGRVTLSRGLRSETVNIIELRPYDAAPVLKKYIARVPITRPFFDASPDSDLDAFRAEESGVKRPLFKGGEPGGLAADLENCYIPTRLQPELVEKVAGGKMSSGAERTNADLLSSQIIGLLNVRAGDYLERNGRHHGEHDHRIGPVGPGLDAGAASGLADLDVARHHGLRAAGPRLIVDELQIEPVSGHEPRVP